MKLLALPLALLAVVPLARPARACGGAPIGPIDRPAASDAQRIFVAYDGQKSEIVTEIAVPATAADYGALIPLPAKPVIDSRPIDATAFEDLDAVTRVELYNDQPGGSSSSGCGCGSSADRGLAGGAPNKVDVTEPVDVGPVTAVAISSTTAGAIQQWLTDNGFAIPAASAAVIDEYSGAGRWFVAIKRNDRTADGSASAIGIHFTIPGDGRVLPLKFTRIGAASRVSFVVFVASAVPSGPASPFTALTVNDLDAVAAYGDYEGAIATAVRAKNGKAMVVERQFERSLVPLGLASLVAADARLTRLTTVLDADMLTNDVRLDGAVPAQVSSEIHVSIVPADVGPWGAAAALALSLLLRSFAQRGRKRAWS